jgi:hypothetical protein
MILLDKDIKDFFNQKIFDLDEDEVDAFFDRYSSEEVIQCLFEKLKVIAISDEINELAWRLGRRFGDLSKNYEVDINSFSWLNISNMNEKIALVNFMSGYWDQSRADFDTLINLSNIVSDAILNELDWSSDLISSGIDAVIIGYSNNKDLFKENLDAKNDLKKIFKLFAEYFSNISGNDFTDYQNSLLKLINKAINS